MYVPFQKCWSTIIWQFFKCFLSLFLLDILLHNLCYFGNCKEKTTFVLRQQCLCGWETKVGMLWNFPVVCLVCVECIYVTFVSTWLLGSHQQPSVCKCKPVLSGTLRAVHHMFVNLLSPPACPLTPVITLIRQECSRPWERVWLTQSVSWSVCNRVVGSRCLLLFIGWCNDSKLDDNCSLSGGICVNAWFSLPIQYDVHTCVLGCKQSPVFSLVHAFKNRENHEAYHAQWMKRCRLIEIHLAHFWNRWWWNTCFDRHWFWRETEFCNCLSWPCLLCLPRIGFRTAANVWSVWEM